MERCYLYFFEKIFDPSIVINSQRKSLDGGFKAENITRHICFETLVKDIIILQNAQLNPLSANPTKWSNTLRQFVGFCRRIV